MSNTVIFIEILDEKWLILRKLLIFELNFTVGFPWRNRIRNEIQIMQIFENFFCNFRHKQNTTPVYL